MPRLTIYDTTLRDGSQREGISFSVTDKLNITKRLDEFGIDYIEGGWPGSNPKDIEYFRKVRQLELKHSKISAFSSTRRARIRVQDDLNIQALLAADTPVVTVFGKSWDFHVTEALGTTLAENIAMIRETVAYLKDKGREVIYDAEHFSMAIAIIGIRTGYHFSEQEGADLLVLCDTNGGLMPFCAAGNIGERNQETRRP